MKQNVNTVNVSFKTQFVNNLQGFFCPKMNFWTSGYFPMIHIEPMLHLVISRWILFIRIVSGYFWLFLIKSG